MEAIKTFMIQMWFRVVLVIGGVFAVVLYILDLKNKKVEGLQAEVDLTTTQKKADVLETKIKASMDDATLKQKDIDDHQKVLDNLEQKRKEIEAVQVNVPPNTAADYWNNQK